MKYKLYEVLIVDDKEDAEFIMDFDSNEDAFAYVKDALLKSGVLRQSEMQMSYLMSKYRFLKKRTEIYFGDKNHFFYVKQEL